MRSETSAMKDALAGASSRRAAYPSCPRRRALASIAIRRNPVVLAAADRVYHTTSLDPLRLFRKQLCVRRCMRAVGLRAVGLRAVGLVALLATSTMAARNFAWSKPNSLPPTRA